MNVLLQTYQSRFGSAVKVQGDAYNGPCPLCGGEPGSSDRFMVWPHRNDNLGYTCAENGISGVCYCRQCGFSGDSIHYLEKVEGLSFKDTLQELGISKPTSNVRRRKAPAFMPEKEKEYQPKERSLPSETWSAYAEKLLAEAQEEIWKFERPRKWLLERGISEEMIRRYGLGLLEGENGKQGRYRSRSALGLEPKKRADGKISKSIFIPRGIVIPTFHGDTVISLRIRRPSADTVPHPNNYTPPKYMELEGSGKFPFMLLPKDGQPMLTSFVVVEAELDAMLCHFAMGEQVGVLALRSNQNKPCPMSHEYLKNSSRILLAMDYEESHAGVAGIEFWEKTYSHVKRWPTPEGKDPGEAFKLGVDIADWIAIGLPGSFAYKGDGWKEF